MEKNTHFHFLMCTTLKQYLNINNAAAFSSHLYVHYLCCLLNGAGTIKLCFVCIKHRIVCSWRPSPLSGILFIPLSASTSDATNASEWKRRDLTFRRLTRLTYYKNYSLAIIDFMQGLKYMPVCNYWCHSVTHDIISLCCSHLWGEAQRSLPFCKRPILVVGMISFTTYSG